MKWRVDRAERDYSDALGELEAISIRATDEQDRLYRYHSDADTSGALTMLFLFCDGQLVNLAIPKIHSKLAADYDVACSLPVVSCLHNFMICLFCLQSVGGECAA